MTLQQYKYIKSFSFNLLYLNYKNTNQNISFVFEVQIPNTINNKCYMVNFILYEVVYLYSTLLPFLNIILVNHSIYFDFDFINIFLFLPNNVETIKRKFFQLYSTHCVWLILISYQHRTVQLTTYNHCCINIHLFQG